jgi:hypothetical protein
VGGDFEFVPKMHIRATNKENMLRNPTILVLALFVCAAFGCGRPPMHEVAGVVTLDGKPISNCKVGFFPDVRVFNPDRHGYGFGLSYNEGKFAIVHPQGEVGIWAGKYKVTLVAWVTKDGKEIEPEAKPSEIPGGVLNLFPDEYESPGTTPLTVNVKAGEKNFFEFNISSKPNTERNSDESK